MRDWDAKRLPVGWKLCKIPEVAQLNPPLDRCIVADDVAVDFIPMRAVEEEGGGILRPEVSAYAKVKKGYTAFLPGDVIMAKITPCMENGKTCVVPDLPHGVCFGSTEFHVVRVEEGIEARWIAYFLLQHSTRHAAQRQMMGGVGQMRVPAAFLEALSLPVPSHAEQLRILDSLDELLSDLDAGVKAFEGVRVKLRQYRAAVLKAAVEGTLTADWRKAHPKGEPASELLKRVLAERRRRWEEAQVKKYKDAGMEPPKNWKSRYPEPAEREEVALFAHPETWAAASMDALTSRITSGSRDWTQYYDRGSGVFIMAQNVRPGRLDLTHLQRVDPPSDDSSCERSQVETDDLLVTIVGANTGDVCRVSQELRQHYVCQSVSLMRPAVPAISKYLEIYFNSMSGGQEHYRRYMYGAGRPHLSFDQLKVTPVVLPPLAEQSAIVEFVEDQLSVIDHLDSDLEAKLKSAQALRQSILKAGFEGKLVPQDPNDEPASELLKRIAAERAERGRLAKEAKKLAPQAKVRRPKRGQSVSATIAG